MDRIRVLSSVQLEPKGAPAQSVVPTPGVPSEPADASANRSGEDEEPLAQLGDLVVHVVDPISRAPLAGITCVVYWSPGSSEPLAVGVTDADGAASFVGLPHGRGVYLETLRAPPRAATSGVACIEAGSVVECELEVGFGGTLRGRVVDDAGLPVANLELGLGPTHGEVLAERAPRGFGVPAARTDAQGRFRIDALESLRSWSALDCALWWYSRDPIEIYALPSNTLEYHVLAGEDVDIGDLVVPRERVYAGKLIGSDGRGIAGALVSAHSKRLDRARAPSELRARPGTAEFVPLPAETTTAEDGGFELRVREDAAGALAWTPHGARGLFPLAELAPGQRVDGLVWEMELDDVLEVVLLGPDGTPLRMPMPRAPSALARPLDRTTVFELETTDGKRARLPLEQDADGVYRWTMPFERAELAALQVELPNFSAARVDGERLRSGKLVSVSLEPLPLLRITLEIPQEHGVERRVTQVRVCRLPPAEREVWGCCGTGSTFWANWGSDADCRIRVELSVLDRSDYWVYVRDGHRSGTKTLYEYGPFEPSDQHTLIALPTFAVVAEHESTLFKEEALFARREIEVFAFVEGSREPIGRMTSDSRGRVLRNAAVARPFLRLHERGFEDVDLSPVVRSGEGLQHLGEVEFKRKSDWPPMIRITDYDRRSRSYLTQVIVATPEGDLSAERAMPNEPLPEHTVPGSTAWVTHRDVEGLVLRSAKLPDPIPADSFDLELEEPIQVEVQVLGLPAAALRSPISIVIAPIPSPADLEFASHMRRSIELRLEEDALLPSRDGTRTFRFGASPGEYLVSAEVRGASLPDFEPLLIAVERGSQKYVFALRSADGR